MAWINEGTRAHAQVLSVNADLGLSNGDQRAERRTFDSLTVKSQLFFLADRWVGVFKALNKKCFRIDRGRRRASKRAKFRKTTGCPGLICQAVR